MILIPEIETVVILVPRTGTGSVKRAIAAKYPRSTMIYRHMEADGVPAGYDRWRRVGVVRNPLDRLWSLYKFLRAFDGDHDGHYIASMRSSVAMPFPEWVVGNLVPFTTPYDSGGLGRFWPMFTVRHPLPENRKSQFIYLRPDLGTEYHRYDLIEGFYDSLGLDEVGRETHATGGDPPPPLTPEAANHMARFFAWDYEVAL